MNRKELILSEWSLGVVGGVHLTKSDHQLAEQLGRERKLLVRAIDGGVEVTTSGWIGVVSFEHCRVIIEPKLIDGYENLVRLLCYVGRLDLMRELSRPNSFEAEGYSLFDLVAMLLARACEDILNAGVLSDYVGHHDELSALRGRVDLRAQWLRRFGQLDVLVCDFEDRTRSIPENQWLRGALELVRSAASIPRVRSNVTRLAATWAEFCEAADLRSLERPQINRVNHHYGRALGLAYLIHDCLSISDVLGSGRVSGFSFVLDMSRLFEEFVATMIENALRERGVHVEIQARDRSVLWNPDRNQSFGSIRPDVVLTYRSRKLPVDAKYKDYGHDKLQPSDVYQAAIYALSQSCHEDKKAIKECLLFHPAASISRQRVQVRVDGSASAEIIAFGLPVRCVLAAGADGLPLLEPITESIGKICS